MPPFSCCNAREHHVTRTGHTDGDVIVAPGPRAYNPAPLMSVACVPDLFFGPHYSTIPLIHKQLTGCKFYVAQKRLRLMSV